MIFLVEGDADKRALPHLLRRQGIATPGHMIDMKGKSNIVRTPRGFEGTVRRQAAAGQRIFALLVDGDVTCAPYASVADERQGLAARAQALVAELDIVLAVFWAHIEFESWLIGGIDRSAAYCSLRRVGAIPANTENHPGDPKAWLKARLRDGYEPRTAECLAQRIDLAGARRRNQSLRTFLGVLAEMTAHRPA